MWGETHVNETLTLDEEKTLLGGLLLGGVGAGEVFTLVEAKDFQHWAHQAVFAVMQDLFMAGVDIDAISVLGVWRSGASWAGSTAPWCMTCYLKPR